MTTTQAPSPTSIQMMETIAQRIRQDNVDNAFMRATPDQRTEFIQTYLADELERSQHLHSRYSSDREFKHYFRGLVFGLLKNTEVKASN
ncbi:hypothetical protein A9Q81_22280 [Gammaproteobacteria bacterium 42_54_T18]|nr:hypothetical protein A9Q81_22280 [Gammaproteobacteria bacterium 42_54_T18]